MIVSCNVELSWVNAPVPVELSVTLTVKLVTPETVGVPVIVQSALSVTPPGSATEGAPQL